VGVTVSHSTWAGTVQLEGRRCRQRQQTVLGRDAAAAERNRRAADTPDLEPRQRNRGAGDVDDGIDGSDLVKMDLFELRAMDPRLGAAERLEDRKCALPNVGLEPRLLDHIDDLVVVAPVGV